MISDAASDSVIDTQAAVTYLREKHGIEYSADRLQRRANLGLMPSHKVGKYRRYRTSLLDQWALGEWEPPKKKRQAS